MPSPAESARGDAGRFSISKSENNAGADFQIVLALIHAVVEAGEVIVQVDGANGEAPGQANIR